MIVYIVYEWPLRKLEYEITNFIDKKCKMTITSGNWYDWDTHYYSVDKCTQIKNITNFNFHNTKLDKYLLKFLVKYDLLSHMLPSKLGYILHSNAEHLGVCFSKMNLRNMNKIYMNDLCRYKIQDIENTFHGILKKIGHEFNIDISIHDIPSLLNRLKYKSKVTDLVQNFPCFSTCHVDPYFIGNSMDYLSQWQSFEKIGGEIPTVDGRWSKYQK